MSVRKSNTRKKMRKEETEKSIITKKSQEKNKNDDSDNENRIILPYDVISIIFKNLNGKDLCSCASVCRLWQEVAVKELESRGPVTKYVLWDDAFTKCFSNHHFDRDLTNKPMLGFLFNGTPCAPPDCMGRHLPKNCVTLLLDLPGIVMNNQEFERAPRHCVYGFLPDDPEVKMEFIMGTKHEVIHYNRDLEVLRNGNQPNKVGVIESMFQEAIDRLKDVKGMIFVTSESFMSGDKLAESKIIKKHVPMFWGGITRKLTACKQVNGVSTLQPLRWMVIFIAGQNVRCWSLVLNSNVTDKNQIREKFITMRKNVELMKRSIGLMFACIGRGISIHREKNVEAKLFKDVFPEVPLIGGFGNGEFGFNYDDKSPGKIGSHQYSTVFMILTYG